MPPHEDQPRPEQPSAAELEQLRRRVSQLEAAAAHPPEHHRMRTTGSVVLIVIASILSLLAVLAVWARNEITDTNRFVATMAPLAKDPQVQAAVSNRITDVVVQQIDINALTAQLAQIADAHGLPPQSAQLLSKLSGPIGSGLTSLIHSIVDKVVSSDAFATVWTAAVRGSHSALSKALTGQGGGAVQLTNNEVTIDIGPLVDKVKTQLVDSGMTLADKIPAVHTSFTVFASPDLAKVKSGFRLLQLLGDWLPVIAVLVAAGGVYLAADRRRALIGAALGIAVAMLVLGVALAVFRGYFLDHLPAGSSPGAAGAVFDALVHFLRQAVRAVGVLAVVVALGAFLTGPSRPATTIRRVSSTGIAGVRSATGFQAEAVEGFVRRFKHWIGVGILVVAAVIFIFWANPTGLVVFWFAVVVLVAFAIREFLAPATRVRPEAGA